MKRWKYIALIISSLVAIYLAAAVLPRIHTRLGRADFIGYWSASYLLAQGENFNDDRLILRTQEALTNSTRAFPVKSWNPPWLLVWLLPLTFLGFDRAATVWLAVNFLLVFVSAVMIWRVYAPASVARHWFWIPILAAFIYPFTLTAMLVGQVNLLVLFGLSAYLYAHQTSRDFSAGVALSLTMVKPHLVYLTLPLILLSAIRDRRWRTLLGFSTFLVASILIVAILRPTFLGEYYASVSGGRLLQYLSPTIPVALSVLLNLPWIRLIGVLLLPVAVWFWLHHEKSLTMGQLIDVGSLASVITAPFLWSYDFVVLLIPLIRIWIWMIDGILRPIVTIGLTIAMLALTVFLFDKRIQTPSEAYYAWFPLVVAALYGFVWTGHKRRIHGK